MNTASTTNGREEITAQGINDPIGHYVDAVRHGDLLYVSGCAPLDVSGELVGSDASDQAEQVFSNMKKVLDAADADFSNILKMTVWLTDKDDREAVNAVRIAYLGDARPASTLVEISSLAMDGMVVEIDAVVACG
jgi:reactive intermediate/imine deaminase